MRQDKHHDEHNDKVSHLHELVKDLEFAMLTTTGENGRGLRSRPMTLQQAGAAGGDFWFFVGKSTAPARDVVLNPQVNLAFSNPRTNVYVSVTGEAELALLRVRAVEADYWEAPTPKGTQLVGLAKALVTGRKAGAELGEREHLGAGDLRAG